MELENRRYWLRTSERWIGFILAPLMAFVWTALWLALFFRSERDAPGVAAALAMLVVPDGLFVWGFLYSLRTTVQFARDEIVVQRALREVRVSRSRAAAFRRVIEGPSTTVHLYEADASEPLIRLPPQIVFDADFDAWLATLVDLDARDSHESMDNFLKKDPTPGSNAEKLAAVAIARRIAQGLTWLAGGLLAWAWFMAGHPLVTLAATGIAALAVVLAVVRPTRYMLGQSKTDVRASLLGACLFSCGAVAVVGLRRGVPVEEIELVGWAVAVTLAVAVGVLGIVPALRGSRADVLGTIALAAFFGIGAVSVANRDLDRGPATVYPAMLEQSLEGDLRERRVLLPGWGPEAKAGVVSLPAELHDSAKEGSSICVQLWPGALGVRWYELRECPAG